MGGDLISLLRQDMRLPESSIHDFGRDLVIALQYLHHNAIVYCDLKPSNVLLDENGRIKLGGFGLSRKLSDINKTPCTSLPSVRRCSLQRDEAASTARTAKQSFIYVVVPRQTICCACVLPNNRKPGVAVHG